MSNVHIALETGDMIMGGGRVPESTAVELVFTTAYTGYEESMTDPSYNGQGLIFAYPLIGNYGVDERRFESDGVQPEVVIARELTDECKEWLASEGVPYVEKLDTRDLVTTIREHGSMKAGVAGTRRKAQSECADAISHGIDMTHTPSEELPQRYNSGDTATIALLDCGVKTSMIDHFVERDAMVIRLPWDVNAEHIWSYDPDLLFVSNGPGNPENYEKAIDTIKSAHGQIPIAGICLGQQLITLALNGSTQKMSFGHRGVNQPVYDKRTKRVRMTTQNHSYEVDRVPEALTVTQYNVNDNSPEGLDGDGVLCRQYHPEANPGPNDSLDFFDDVLSL